MMSLILLMSGLLFKNLLMMLSILMIGVSILWLNLVNVSESGWEMKFSVLMDSLSIMLVALTIWVCLSIFVVKEIWKIMLTKNLMGLIMFLLMMCLFSDNVFSFYIFFELVLIPMFLLIIFDGGYAERKEGGFYLLFYTMLGSLPLFMMIMSGFYKLSWNFSFMIFEKMSCDIEGIMSISVISAFLSKLPMYGVHIWLPKAHVEAPMIGSMILAGVLLKLGGYGIFRFSPFLTIGINIKSLIVIISLVGSINCGLICLWQNDMKKLVAYSSVIHSGIGLAGSMTFMEEGWMGMMMMSVCHGLCSSSLFFFVNSIFERVMTRSMMLSKGCLGLCPSMMMWCFLLIVVNSGCPPFLSLFSESTLIMSLVKWEFILLMILSLMLFITVAYNIYFYSMVSHGENSLILFKPVLVQEYLLVFLHFCPSVFLIFSMDSFIYNSM